MSLCKNRVAVAFGRLKKTLASCTTAEQKIAVLASMGELLSRAKPQTPIYDLGGRVQGTGRRVLLGAVDVARLLDGRIKRLQHPPVTVAA